MADISIRKLDDFVAMALKQRAQAHGVSLEEEIRRTLRDGVLKSRADFSEDLRRMREEIRAKFGTLPDSTQMLREERDEM